MTANNPDRTRRTDDQIETSGQGQVPWWQERDRSELRPPWNDQEVYELAVQAHERQQSAQQALETLQGTSDKIAAAFGSANELLTTAQDLENSPTTSLDLLADTPESKYQEASTAFVEAHTAQYQVNKIEHGAHTLLTQACTALTVSYERAHQLVHGDTPLNQTYEGLMAQAMQERKRMYSAKTRASGLMVQASDTAIRANAYAGRRLMVDLNKARRLRKQAEQHNHEALEAQSASRALAQEAANALGDWMRGPVKPAPWDESHWQSTWGDDYWPRGMAWKDYEPPQRRRRKSSTDLSRGRLIAQLRRRQKLLDQKKDGESSQP